MTVDEGDLGAQQVDLARAGARRAAASAVPPASSASSKRRPAGSPRPRPERDRARRAGSVGERDRALEERRRGGEPAALLGAVGGRSSSMATSSFGPAVAAARCQARRSGSTCPIGRLGQCQVDRAAFLRRRRPVDRRTRQRVTEVTRCRSPASLPASAASAASARSPAARMRATAASDRRPAPPPRPTADAAPHQTAHRVAAGSSPRSVPAARARRQADPPATASRSNRGAARSAPVDCPASPRRCGPGPLVQLGGHHWRAARGRRRRRRRDLQHGHVPKRVARLRGRRRRSRPARPAGAGRRSASVSAELIQPLRVIDHAQQRTLLSGLREQTQHREPEDKAIRRLRRRSGRTRSRWPGAGGPGAAGAGRAAVRTAGGGWRTRAPSPTRHPPPGRR